jgi:biotin carboxyl carrier protein
LCGAETGPKRCSAWRARSTSTLGVLRALVDFAPVVDASYGTATLEPFAAALAATARNGSAGAPADLVPSAAGPVGAYAAADAQTLRVEVNGKLFWVRFVDLPAGLQARPANGNGIKSAAKKISPRRSATTGSNEIRSPMHGVIVEIPVREGQSVAEGDVVVIIEAMKMMNEIRAHKAGLVAAIHTAPGATVEAQTPLITLA